MPQQRAIFDPQGRPTVTDCSYHYFHTWRLSAPTFQTFGKQNIFRNENSDRYWRECGSGRVDYL